MKNRGLKISCTAEFLVFFVSSHYISTNTESVSLFPRDERRMNVGHSFGWGMGTHLAASYPYSADIGVGVVAYFESKGILRPIPIEIGFGTTLSFCILPSGCGRQNKFFFMKKWILLALLCAMLGACGKDSDSDSYRLKKATVKGAVMVYQSSDGTRGTRAGDDYPRFYTVDEAGNVKSIRFITDKGDTLDLCIAAVKSLAGRYMLLRNTSFGFPRVLLVDTDTEYVYEVKGISNDCKSFKPQKVHFQKPELFNVHHGILCCCGFFF